jgi:hypothetical protein
MSMAAVLQRLRAGSAVLSAALREIFDESAYHRFLARTGRERSARSFGDFLAEKEEQGRRPRARCC